MCDTASVYINVMIQPIQGEEEGGDESQPSAAPQKP